jgi:isoleucyl-tRNA synthetase
MYTWNFFLGVTFALVSGIINNLGTLLQKRAVNEYLKKRISELSSSGELVRDEKYPYQYPFCGRALNNV